MRNVLLYALLVLIAAGPASAGTKNKTANKDGAEDNWYVYRFVYKDGYKIPPQPKCVKSKYSPGDVAEHREKNGINYKIIEQSTHKGKPLVVDVQSVDIHDVGYDYNPSTGRARSSYPVELIITDRFIKGKKLCGKILQEDLSGSLDKRKFDRYR